MRRVRDHLVKRWKEAYTAATPWTPSILEIEIGSHVYLFDSAPSLGPEETGGEDRVVVVWGESSPPEGRRDRRRLAGFIPVPAMWSERQRDRGHLIGHSLGGGLDLNLVPQARALNRGRSMQGRRWRALEREAAAQPGTPVFVRPIYNDGSWVPTELEFGLLRENGLHVESFRNRGP